MYCYAFVKLTFIWSLVGGVVPLPTTVCPPGHFITCLDSNADCENSVCVLCPEGTYTNTSGAFTQCDPCRKPCNLTLEVESAPCIPVSDRKCSCQAGYYPLNPEALYLNCIRVTEEVCDQGQSRLRPGLEDGSPIVCEPCPTGFTSLGNSSECFLIPELEGESGTSKEIVLVLFIAALFVIGLSTTLLMYCLCKEKEKKETEKRKVRKLARDNDRMFRRSSSSTDDVRRMAMHAQVRKISRQYNQSDFAKNNLEAIFAPVGVPKGYRKSSTVSGRLKEVQSCPNKRLDEANNKSRSFEHAASAPVLPKCVQFNDMANDDKDKRASHNTIKPGSISGQSSTSQLDFSVPGDGVKETSKPLLGKSTK